MEDFHQVRQEGDRIRFHRQEVPERPQEGEAGVRRTTGGGLERWIDGTGEEPGQSQTALRETVSRTRTCRRRRELNKKN